MIIQENQVWKERLGRMGDSYALLVSRDMLEYMGVTNVSPEKDKLVVVIKADNGKWGKFIGFGIDKGEDKPEVG